MTFRQMFEPLVATIEARMADLTLIWQLRLGGGMGEFVHFEGPLSGENGLAAGKIALMTEFEVEGLKWFEIIEKLSFNSSSNFQ